VPPLALTGGATSDAVTLFVDRAQAVRPNFGLSDLDTATAITEICETLDGLPLGIELAAARMAAMSAAEVRDRLADRFRLRRRSDRSEASPDTSWPAPPAVPSDSQIRWDHDSRGPERAQRRHLMVGWSKSRSATCRSAGETSRNRPVDNDMAANAS
jgi:predicted ATPase